MHILAQFPWLFLFSLFLFIFRPPKASLGAISVSLGAAGNILPPTVPMKEILIAPLELHSLFPSSPMWGPRWPPRAWKLPGLGATWVSRQGTTDPSSQQVLWRWCSALRCCLCGSAIAGDRLVSSPVLRPTLTIALCLWWSAIFSNPKVRQPVTDGPRLWSLHRRTSFAPLIWLSLSICTRREQDLTVRARQGSTVWLYEPTTRVCVAI